MKALLLMVFIMSCASIPENHKKDVADGERYPDCHHKYRIVFQKCVALNDAGQKVDAMRTEQLMKDGKVQ